MILPLPRRTKLKKLPNAGVIHASLLSCDKLHRASVYLAGQFNVEMNRDDAQANVQARTILVNIQNHILDVAYGLYRESDVLR